VIKQVILPLAAVMVFIIEVGLFMKNSQKLPFAVATPAGNLKSLTINSTSIPVEISKTKQEREKGLSGRSSLPGGSGMLFVFDSQKIVPNFWMKDMQIAIDIIWIADNKITKIDKNVLPPAADTPDTKLVIYSPGKPIDYVLEVESGFCDKNNIKVGDSVTLPTL